MEQWFDFLQLVKLLPKPAQNTKTLHTFTRDSNVPTRSQEQKNQKPRGSQSKLAFAWEELFECNLHVAGSRPEATIQGFACELWGNRDIAEHSCWGKAYLCCCLSCCRCWQEAGGGPGWDRGWWVHEGAGVYTVLCSVKPVHHFIGNHCSEKTVCMLILKLQHESERVSCYCGLCQTVLSDQTKVTISPIPQEFWWGLTIISGPTSFWNPTMEGRIPTTHLWPLLCPVLYISGQLMAAPPSHGHWAPTFPFAHWWEGWGSHFLRRSVGISQLTLQMHTQGVNALFHPKLPSWKQDLWMFRSLWLTNLKCRHTVSFRIRGITKCNISLYIILILVSSDASFLVMSLLISYSQCPHTGMACRESKNVSLLCFSCCNKSAK